jgi:succinate dehydrogenase / fumarate reductase cytochrome b subunit
MAAATQELSTPAGTAESSRPLLWARLGSILSILPLGIWTVVHLWHNLAVLRSPEDWQKQVTEYAHPISSALTFILVLAPLILHALWGVQRLFSFRPNNGAYNTFDNLKYLLQRITAAGVFFFIGAHLWLAMLHPRLTTGQAEPFSDIAAEMHHHLPTLLVYLLGTLGVAYHLGNGLYSFAWSWGLMAGRRSFRSIGLLSVLTFAGVLAMAWTVIFALYSAGANLPPVAD